MAMPELEPVAVVGVGVIGTTLVDAIARSGLRTIAYDRSTAALEGARATIRRTLLADRLGAETTPLDTSSVLDRIEFGSDPTALASARFVVENVDETWDAKCSAYATLREHVGPEVVIAANTSCFPIDKLAGLAGDPSAVVGIHFMNPVPRSRAAEVIVGPRTSPRARHRAISLVETMGKRAIEVSDSPGFVSNRVLMLTINEAIGVLDDGVADATDVDRVFVECFGHAMGPLATADLIGLDTIRNSLLVLRDELDGQRFAPATLLDRMVAAGDLGRKSGQGFFTYAARSTTQQKGST